MRALPALALVAALALSGCIGGADEASQDETLDATTYTPERAPIDGPTHFELGPSLGCEGEALRNLGLLCVSFVNGPDAPPVDGFWVPLGPSYWRHAFTSTIDSPVGDSDCYFVADDAATLIDTAFRGADPCGGTVPDGTAWLFLYSYAAPAAGMTVTFQVPG